MITYLALVLHTLNVMQHIGAFFVIASWLKVKINFRKNISTLLDDSTIMFHTAENLYLHV